MLVIWVDVPRLFRSATSGEIRVKSDEQYEELLRVLARGIGYIRAIQGIANTFQLFSYEGLWCTYASGQRTN